MRLDDSMLTFAAPSTPKVESLGLASKAPIEILDGAKSSSEVGSCGIVELSSGVMARTLVGFRSILAPLSRMKPLRETLVVAVITPALITVSIEDRDTNPSGDWIRPVEVL